METKVCIDCHIEKSLDDYYVCGGRRVGHCKKCSTKRCLASSKKNPQAKKEAGERWRSKNKARISDYHKSRYLDGKDKIKENTRTYAKNNRIKYNQYNATWRARNRDSIIESQKKARDRDTEILSDSYLVKTLSGNYNIPSKTIRNNPEIIECYRAQIKAKRLIKNIKTKQNGNTKTRKSEVSL